MCKVGQVGSMGAWRRSEWGSDAPEAAVSGSSLAPSPTSSTATGGAPTVPSSTRPAAPPTTSSGPAEPLNAELKVHYLIDGGYSSTAYLDDRPLRDGSHVGTNKHSDLPVHLRWNGDDWVQVCQRTFTLVNVYNEEYAEHDRPSCICQEYV